MAARASHGRLQAFYRKDALEEFWHCDAFYFVDQPSLALDSERVKAHVPLPASTAFEDIALSAADRDWLGHLLIAYFQESSLIFRSDSEEFYDSAESNNGLRGFIGGWRRHMSLDFEHRHADGLSHFFLLRALDQVQAHATLASDAIELRQPTTPAGQDMCRLFVPSRDVGHPFLREHLLGVLHSAVFGGLASVRRHVIGPARFRCRS